MTQQRTKGPGSAGGPPKENLGADEDTFGYLRTQIPAQPYGSLSNTTNMNDNPYLAAAPAGNYYPFPYGLGDGNTAWSSGGEPMFSFGNYGHAGNLAAGHAPGNLPGQTNDHHTSIYGAGPSAADFGSSFGYGSHPPAAPGFSYFPSAGEYDTWGTGGRTKTYDDYYRTSTAQQQQQQQQHQQQQQQQQQHSLGPLASVASSSSNSTIAGAFDYASVNGDGSGSVGGFGGGAGSSVGLHEGLKTLDQTMGGLAISGGGGGDKAGVMPHMGVGVGGVSNPAGGVGDGNLVSPKDLFQRGGGNLVGVDHGLSGGSNSGAGPSIGVGSGVSGVGLGSPHMMGVPSASVGIPGSGVDGSIPPGPGGLGTSGGVGGLISSGGVGNHLNSSVGGSGGGSVGHASVSPKQQQLQQPTAVQQQPLQQQQPPQPSQAQQQQQQQQQPAAPAGPPAPPAKKSWASIASQPAKPQPKVIKAKTIAPAPVLVTRNAGNMDIGTWGETSNNRSDSTGDRGGVGKGGIGDAKPGAGVPRNAWGTASAPRQGGRDGVGGSAGGGGTKTNNNNNRDGSGNLNHVAAGSPQSNGKVTNNPNGPNAAGGEEVVPTVLKELMVNHKYNPKDYNQNPKNARFFVIKSYSEDDIHRSIKYGIWCSTEHGNKRLDDAFRSQDQKGPVLLFYSVNGSGHFCGMAQMMGHVDYDRSSSVWLQDKWKGQFVVKWIYVKDVPNSQLRHIRLENNENKPVTNSRDTQEILGDKGKQVLKIINQYKHSTSIFDDFGHYEKRQEVETFREGDIAAPAAPPAAAAAAAAAATGGPNDPQQRK